MRYDIGTFLEEQHKKREDSIPKIYRFLSKLGQELWDINKIKPHHIETAHDIHALYIVKEPEISNKFVFPKYSMLRSGVEMNGRYIHVQVYPGFSFEPYSKEEEVCLAACYHTQPRDHIFGEEPSICLGWLADQKNYGFEETEDVAKLILKNIQGIDKGK